jgi:hypothetical protein
MDNVLQFSLSNGGNFATPLAWTLNDDHGWLTGASPGTSGSAMLEANGGTITISATFHPRDGCKGDSSIVRLVTSDSFIPGYYDTCRTVLRCDAVVPTLLALVGDGTNITFYVDGSGFPGSGMMGAKPSGASTRTLNFGRCPSSSPECQFSGLIDEPAIYNLALSASEIQAIVAAGSGGRCALVAVTDPPPSARRFEFAPPWPNPAERVINLEFRVPASAVVRAGLVDVAGRRVSALLEDGVLAAGAHRLRWDGRDPSGHRVAPGVYLVRISADAEAVIHRIVVIR